MATRVRVTFHPKGEKARTVSFMKPGTKAQLCTVKLIRVGGHTFRGRRGGRTLCGPSTGMNTSAARSARRAFTRTWGHRRRRGRR